MKKIFRSFCLVLMMVSIGFSAFASSLHDQKHLMDHHSHSSDSHIVEFEDYKNYQQEEDTSKAHKQHAHHCCGSSFVMYFQTFAKINLVSLKDSFSISKNENLTSLKLDTPERPPLS